MVLPVQYLYRIPGWAVKLKKADAISCVVMDKGQWCKTHALTDIHALPESVSEGSEKRLPRLRGTHVEARAVQRFSASTIAPGRNVNA